MDTKKTTIIDGSFKLFILHSTPPTPSTPSKIVKSTVRAAFSTLTVPKPRSDTMWFILVLNFVIIYGVAAQKNNNNAYMKAGLERNGTYLGINDREALQTRIELMEDLTKSEMYQDMNVVFTSEEDLSISSTDRSSSTIQTKITFKTSAAIQEGEDAIGIFCDNSLLDFITLEDGFQREATTVALESNHVGVIHSLFHRTRCQLELKYMIKGLYPLASSAHELTNMRNNEPYHLRIAYGPEPQTQMWLSWTSDSNVSTPYVLIGLEPKKYNLKYTATRNEQGEYWDTYYPSDMCGSPANKSNILYYMFPGFFANILVTGLKPSTRYYAQYGSDEGVFGETVFTTGKPIGDVPVRIAAFGDMALSIKGAVSTVHHIVSMHAEAEGNEGLATADAGIDAVLHFGDLGYAMGSTVIWDLWHAYVETATSTIPYLVSVGNHELDHYSNVCYQEPSGDAGSDGTGWHPEGYSWGDDSQGEGGAPIYHRFKTPACLDNDITSSPSSTTQALLEQKSNPNTNLNGNSIFWYSFSLGSLHIIQLSSEHDYSPGSEQYKWVELDLMRVRRLDSHMWVVVTLHRPMVSPEAGAAHDDGTNILAALEPLFLSYGVSMVLGGHAHVYERMCPMKAMECVPASEGGITYITVGSAGATVHNSTMVDGFSDWVVDWRVEWGFGVITAVNSSYLKWEFFSNSEKKFVDEFVLTN